MESIAIYSLGFVGLVALVWRFLGQGAALFCIYIGVVSVVSVIFKYRFGNPTAVIISCAMIVLLPALLWLRMKLNRPKK